MESLLFDIVIIFALSVVASIVCHRLRVPTSIGLLLTGVLAGPDALGLVRNVHQIEVLSEIGVVLLLFVIGLEFSLADISNLGRQFLVGGSVQFFGTALLVGVVTALMGSTPAQSAYIGFVVALSSTAVVLKLLQERTESNTPHGRSVIATLIYQDIAVVPLMLTAPLLAGGAAGGGSGSLGVIALRVAGVGVFAFVAYRWAVPWVLERITRTRSSEAFLLGVIALCVGIAVLTQSAGLSLALGAFLAGLIISESEYSHQAVSVILPFRDVFVSLFFVSIGMLLDIQYLVADPLRIGLLTAGVLIVKPVVGSIATLATGLPLRSAVVAGLALGQVGEFSLVATQAGVAAGLFGAEVFQTVLDVAVLSMMLTPALMALAPRCADFVCVTPLARIGSSAADAPDGVHSEHEGHVVIVGFGVTGRNLAMTARASDVPYAILELNAATVREAKAAGEPIHYGDASQEPLLRHVNAEKARAIVVVIDDPAGARRIVETSRRIAPDAYILVRSRYLREVEVLLGLGADEVIADEMEVSIEVFSRVLARMLVPREDIKRFIGEVRGEWRRMARNLSKESTSIGDLRVVVPDLVTHTIRLGPASPLVGATIAQSGIRARYGVTVLAVTRDGETIGNPHSDLQLAAGDLLFVIGPADWDPATIT